MKAKLRKCPGCPDLMLAGHVLCRRCLKGLPGDLRDGLSAARNDGARREAVRRVMEHVTNQLTLSL